MSTDHFATVREALEACQSLGLPVDIGIATDDALAALAEIEKDHKVPLEMPIARIKEIERRRIVAILEEERNSYDGTGIARAVVDLCLDRITGGDDAPDCYGESRDVRVNLEPGKQDDIFHGGTNAS